MAIYFTSDLHFGSKLMINKYNRPKKTVSQMNDLLVKNWNEVVGKFDLVFILGDLSDTSLEETISYLDKLNGKKYLIIGNHDTELILYPEFVSRFVECTFYKRIKVNNYYVTMSHKPLDTWEGKNKGYVHLHGHIHDEQLFENGLCYNVGVDSNNYRPILLSTALNKMKYKERVLSYIQLNRMINNINISDADTLYRALITCHSKKDAYNFINSYKKCFSNQNDCYYNIATVLKCKDDVRLKKLFDEFLY